MSADEGGLGAERLAELRQRAEAIQAAGTWMQQLGIMPDDLLALLDKLDRLTRERDEAREVVARMRGLADEWICCPGDSSCEAQNYSDRLRAALGPRLVVGRDQAADRSQGPFCASQGHSSASRDAALAHLRATTRAAGSDWPVEWTYDGPAVRPSDDEGETDR